ncbi:Hypothetical_protein [Hexamita inflata]|uniref:Hypothetical_protein n=1 Tax=Hexamita inflata TaxID=28002 RepID=A0AA86U390_9EUKA|nr:Hypothetical protein HINF_LOCUS28140 [Hexamita inflata]
MSIDMLFTLFYYLFWTNLSADSLQFNHLLFQTTDSSFGRTNIIIELDRSLVKFATLYLIPVLKQLIIQEGVGKPKWSGLGGQMVMVTFWEAVKQMFMLMNTLYINITHVQYFHIKLKSNFSHEMIGQILLKHHNQICLAKITGK